MRRKSATKEKAAKKAKVEDDEEQDVEFDGLLARAQNFSAMQPPKPEPPKSESEDEGEDAEQSD